jgi:hypothetical protein
MLDGASAAEQRASEHASGRLITSRGWRKATAGQARRLYSCLSPPTANLAPNERLRHRPAKNSSSGGRIWWAHFEFTHINIAPTIVRKKIEDPVIVRAVLTREGSAVSRILRSIMAPDQTFARSRWLYWLDSFSAVQRRAVWRADRPSADRVGRDGPRYSGSSSV